MGTRNEIFESIQGGEAFIKYILCRFNELELRHILGKVELAIIKPNVIDVLIKEFGSESYSDEISDMFFKKYAGKTVNIYKWCNDWWICEDDNYVLTEKCFEIVN